MVLEAIEKQGNPAELQAAKGEALVARAFNHFILVNIFSKAYSPKLQALILVYLMSLRWKLLWLLTMSVAL